MKLKKIIITTALVVLLLNLTAFAVDNPSSFSDVPSSHWAYTTIMKSVDLGLFNGTTEVDANGVGTFSPEKDMTRAEFLVVSARALGLEYDSSVNWYEGAVEALISEGIITKSDFQYSSEIVDYNASMNRQEMAYVMAKVLEHTGETLKADISSRCIPDYAQIDTYYRDEVVKVYSNGILQGTDTTGKFNPLGTLDRAQAATVLIRLVDSTARANTQTDEEYYAEQETVKVEAEKAPETPVKSEESAKPAHEHNWVPITVHHDETGHYEKTYEERTVIHCNCGKDFYDNDSYQAHIFGGSSGEDCLLDSWVADTKVEIGKTWVVDQAAWDEVVGYKCECGATK